MTISQMKHDADEQCRTVAEMAHDRLKRSNRSQLGMVVCHLEQGVLFLRGQLPSYYHKQLAQEAVREMVGVNEIEVTPA
jgi:osmotically-inducible protein OsmY